MVVGLFILGCGSEKVDSVPEPGPVDTDKPPSSDPSSPDAKGENATKAAKTEDSIGVLENDQSSALLSFINDIPTIQISETLEEGTFPICANSSVTQTQTQKPQEASLCPVEADFEADGMAFVCTYQKYSVTKIPEKFVAINPYVDALWPGAIIQGLGLTYGILNPVPLSDRSPGTITMTLATNSNGQFSKNLPKPSLASATEAISEILSSNIDIATPAKFYYKLNKIYSNEHLSVALGAHLNTPIDLEIQTQLLNENQDRKNRMLVDFTQEYFSIAFSPENKQGNMFLDSVTVDDISPYTGDDNPLTYMSSITYGRKIFLLFESDAKMKDLENAIKASFQGYGFAPKAKLARKNKEIMSESHINAYVLGGNAEDALAALDDEDDMGTTIVNLGNLIKDGANFTQGNPGVPISYTIRHVKDATQLKLAFNTEYTSRDCSPVAQVQNPSNRRLKVTLDKVDIDEENGFCEPPLNKKGEFYSCLNVQVGSQEVQEVFCDKGRRQAAPGETIQYGKSNHSLTIDVEQKPGETIEFSGSVLEKDFKDTFEEILTFSHQYELDSEYRWHDWQEQNSVTGVFNGCKATLHYRTEWEY